MADVKFKNEFFNKVLKIASQLGQSRTEKRQKQQEFENLASTRALNLQERVVSTGEKGQFATEALGKSQTSLDRATLQLRKKLGRGQLSVSQRQVGVSEGSLGLKQKGFERSSKIFDQLFPNLSKNKKQASGVNRGVSDESILTSAQALVGTKQEGALSNPRIQKLIKQAQNRTTLKSTLEQDLLSLR